VSSRLAVTAGDPRGIGPEIINKALADPRVGGRSDLVIVGADGCGVEVDESIGSWGDDANAAMAGRLSGRAIERAVELGQPKIQNFRVMTLGYQNVGGFDIAMDDTLGMRRVQGIRYFNCDREKSLQFYGAIGDDVLQGDAIEELHRNEWPSSVLADFVNCANVRVI